MSKKIVKHHYTECGLPDIWIQGFCVRDDAGEEVFVIPKIKLLHKLISHAVVMSGRALSGPEIRFLRAEMGLTPDALGGLVCREGATVVRWEHGKTIPDGAIDVLIRIIATINLGLHGVDLKESIGKWKSVAGVKSGAKSRIRIDATNPDNYRLIGSDAVVQAAAA